jgi:hypothetical protein
MMESLYAGATGAYPGTNDQSPLTDVLKSIEIPVKSGPKKVRCGSVWVPVIPHVPHFLSYVAFVGTWREPEKDFGEKST